MNNFYSVVSKPKDLRQLVAEVFERLGITEPTAEQSALVQALFDYLASDRGIYFNSRLSEREKMCLYLLARGKSLEQIATAMNIKRTTVATFIKRIKAKLDCDTLPQAVFEGMGCNLLTSTASPLPPGRGRRA